jgi:hypothetical protein
MDKQTFLFANLPRKTLEVREEKNHKIMNISLKRKIFHLFQFSKNKYQQEGKKDNPELLKIYIFCFGMLS